MKELIEAAADEIMAGGNLTLPGQRASAPEPQRDSLQLPKPTQQDLIELAADEIMAMKEPSFGTRLKEAGKSAVGGALVGSAGAIEGATRFMQPITDAFGINEALGMEKRNSNPYEGVTNETIGSTMAHDMKDVAPMPDPRTLGDFWTSKIPGFVGGMAPYAVSQTLAGPLGPAITGAFQMGAASHEDALAGGATEEEAQTAFWQGMGVGTLMALPVAKIFSRIDKSQGIRRALTQLAATGGTGYGVGVAMKVMTNAIHNEATDDEVALLQGALDEGMVMGVGSMILHGAMDGARDLRNGKKGRQPATPEEILALEKSLEDAARETAPVKDTLPAEKTPSAEPEKQPIPIRDTPPEPIPYREDAPPIQNPFDVVNGEDVPVDAGMDRFAAPKPKVSVPVDVANEPQRRAREQEQLTQQAKNLLTTRTTELEGMLRSRIALEEAALRKQFPDREEGWYEKVAEKREQARDPLNTEGDKAALELKRLGVKPLDAEGYTAEQITEALRVKYEGEQSVKDAANTAYSEQGRKGARRARTEAEARAQERAGEAAGNIGRGVQYSPDPAQLGAGVGGGGVNYGLKGTTANTLPPGVEPVSKQNVMNTLMNVLRAAGSESPILQGRVPASAGGLFAVIPNVVRIKNWGDLYVASHEIGHALERAVFGWTGEYGPWESGKAGVRGHARAELYKLGKNLYGETVPAGGYYREGFAEYVRKWISDPDSLMKDAPNFTQWFDRTFLPSQPEVMRAMEAARETTSTWRLQGSKERIAAQQYDPEEFGERMARAEITARYLVSAQAWTMGDHAFKVMEKQLEKKLGRPLTAQEKLVDLATSVRRQSDAALNMLVDGATILDDGVTVTGMSLKQALAPARGKAKDLLSYLYAMRALAYYDLREPVLDANGQRIQGVSMRSPKDPGISLEDAQAWRAEVEATMPEVVKAAQEYYAWHERVNDYIASVDPEMGAVLKNMDAMQNQLHPGGFESNYVPLKRHMDEMDAAVRRMGTKSRARRMEITRAITGSGREVKSILPEILAQTNERISMAYTRVPLLRLAELAEAHPEFSAPFIRLASEKARQIVNSSFTQSRIALAKNGPVSPEAVDVLGSALSFFSKPIVVPGEKNPIMPVYRNGRMEVYEVNPEIYKGLLNLHSPQFKNSWAHALLTVPKNMVVLGSTAANIAFGWITNPMMDLPTFLANTIHYGNPAAALAQWSKYSLYSMLDGASDGYFHKVAKDPYYDAYQKLLLEYGQSYHVNSGRYGISSKRLLKTGIQRKLDPGNVFDYMGKIISGTEKAARVAEARGALKELGWDGKRPLTPEEVMQVRTDSKQVTIDFTQAGDLARAGNQMIPFFNSPIQALVAWKRAAQDHPVRMAAFTAAYLGATYALWDRNKDKEWYKQLPLWERMTYWHQEVEIDGRTEIVRVKKPGEWAVLSGIMEELTDANHRNGAFRTGEVAGESLRLLAPNLQFPVLANEFIQQSTNYDYFRGREIVPGRIKPLAAAGKAYEQIGEHSTEAAKWIGKRFNISPLQVDHALRSLFGSAPLDVMAAAGLGPDNATGGASGMPWIGRLFKMGGPIGPGSVALRDFYKLREIADGNALSTETPETDEQRYIRLMLEDGGAAIAAINWVRVNKAKTTAERDDAYAKMIEIAKRANALAVEGKWDPVGLKVERNTAEMQRSLTEMELGKMKLR